MVNIEGLKKEEVLLGLYNGSHCQGISFLGQTKFFTLKEARKALLLDTYFDYLNGHVMKVDLSSDIEFDEGLYDRDNGVGEAQRIIDHVRFKQESNYK